MTEVNSQNKVRTFNTQYFMIGSMALLMVSLTLSPYFMSVAQFMMVFFWLCDIVNISFDVQNKKTTSGILKNAFAFIGSCLVRMYKNLIIKIKQFVSNKPALIFASAYFMHIVGMLWTNDFLNGLGDLRIKLPLLILPLIISTMTPLNKKQFHFLLIIYISAIFVNTLISTWVLFKTNVVDTRDISLFISHIRFSLNICLAVFILIYYVFKPGTLFNIPKIVLILLIAWFVIFLFMLKSLSGIVVFIVVAFILTNVKIRDIKQIRIKHVLFSVVFAIPLLIIAYVFSVVKNYTTPEPLLADTLSTYTEMGNPYQHDTINLGIENGRYIGLYVSWDELEEAWNKVSENDFNGLDKRGNKIAYTLIRYLNSKDLRKDASGIRQLSEKDITNVENGVANIIYLNRLNIKSKIFDAVMGYQRLKLHDDPNSNTFTQRIEHWRASIHVIRQHPLFGVGTGDVDRAIRNAYDELNSNLESRWRMNPHNQYFTIAIGFGLIGLAWYIIALVLPVFMLEKQNNYFLWILIAIVGISMFFDDTLNTQAGITFFTCFYFCFAYFNDY